MIFRRFPLSGAWDTSHYPKDVPFEVPEGWVWTTIGDILINRDEERIPVSSAIRKKQNAKLYDYYGAAGVIDKVDDYLFNERLLLVGEDGANLLSRSKDNAFFAEGKYWVNNHAHIIDASDKRLLDYIALYINAIPLDMYVTGSAQPKLNQDNLNRISVPLPPLAEQFRIVQAVEECKRIVNGIENNQVELQETIDHTKQKILSLAIAGKLVPQDLTDEPAAELLKRINPAFQPSDNLHYGDDLPSGWFCANYGDLNRHKNRSENPMSSPDSSFELYSVPAYETGSPEYITGKEIGSTKQLISKGDVLLCKINPHLNRVWIVSHFRPELKCIASSEWLVFQFDVLLPEYVRVFFMSPEFRILMLSNVSGVGGSLMRAHGSAIESYPIWVPPINEQRRIVNCVNTYCTILDEIAAGIK